MNYQARFTIPDDIPQCIAISRDARLHNLEQNRQREQLWRTWLEQGSALSVVVVDQQQQVKAFGLSVAVREEFVQRLRSEPVLLPLSHLLLQQEDAVLPPSQAVQAHRRDGVHLLSFHGWRSDLLSYETPRMFFLLLRSFLHLHHGLHLQSFTKEVYGDEELSHYIDMGCDIFRESEEFAPSFRRLSPYLVRIDRDIVHKHPRFATYLHALFVTGAPSFHLRSSQLEMAQLAYLLEVGDEEMAELLGIQESVVRQRWCRLYDLLDQAGIAWHHAGRNSQRHDFLRFVEHHREVVFPVLIGRHFYRHPDLAKRFPIPVE